MTTPLTIAELRLRHAQLTERAERLRSRNRMLKATSTGSAEAARDARQTQLRADDYAHILTLLEAPGGR